MQGALCYPGGGGAAAACVLACCFFLPPPFFLVLSLGLMMPSSFLTRSGAFSLRPVDLRSTHTSQGLVQP